MQRVRIAQQERAVAILQSQQEIEPFGRKIEDHGVPCMNNLVAVAAPWKLIQYPVDEMEGRNVAGLEAIEQFSLRQLRINIIEMGNPQFLESRCRAVVIEVQHHAAEVKNHRIEILVYHESKGRKLFSDSSSPFVPLQRGEAFQPPPLRRESMAFEDQAVAPGNKEGGRNEIVNFTAMTPIPSSWPEISLLPENSRQEQIALLFQQLERDFERAAVHLPFTRHDPVETWVGSLAAQLETLDSHQLHRLIYLVDLPETLVRSLAGSEPYFVVLAEAMLYREFVKVQFKRHFREGNPGEGHSA